MKHTSNLNQILKDNNIQIFYSIYSNDNGLDIYSNSNKFIIEGYLSEGVMVKRKFRNKEHCLRYFNKSDINEIDIYDLL